MDKSNRNDSKPWSLFKPQFTWFFLIISQWELKIGNDFQTANQNLFQWRCAKNIPTVTVLVDDSTASYVTTVRGCQLTVKEGICKQIMTTKSTKAGVQTGVLCETCETDLCNSSLTRSLSLSALLIVTFMVILNV